MGGPPMGMQPQQQQMTDEEQAWLEQQMMQAEAAQPKPPPSQPPEEQTPDLPPTPTPSASTKESAAESGPGDYDDVMKLIEENRRKNEAKRAVQSARNAEIIAAFEQRQGMSGQQ